MDIREALSNLDPFNDDQWTAEGAPKIDVLKELLGRPVTRQEITDAAPHFTRENFTFEDPAATVEELAPTFDASILVDFADKEPMDVNSFLGFLMTVPKDGLTYLQEVLRKQQADVAAARKKLDDQEFKIRGALVHTKARIAREIPDISEAEANRRYIAKQQELRAQKHAATTALLKGVDLKSLDPRSAIDRAMARKNTRGSQRPNVGQKA